jgi:uncharacterized C2H2 Zn-finger protein
MECFEKSKMMKPFYCDHCDKVHVFGYKTDFQKHSLKLHGDKSKLDVCQSLKKCDHCDKVFTFDSDLSRHQTVHNKLRAFKCTVCSERFAQKGHLHRHVTNAHVTKIHEKQNHFQCDNCDKVFASKIGFKRHFLKLHGQKSKLDVFQSQKKCLSCYKTLTNAVVRFV